MLNHITNPLRLVYHTICSCLGCDKQFTSNEGSIQSPLYPSSYPEDIECTWVISVEKPSRIRLTFEPLFDLENEERCAYDFLRIRDGANVVDKEIGRY